MAVFVKQPSLFTHSRGHYPRPAAHFGERKGRKDAQNTPEGGQKRAKIEVAERGNGKRCCRAPKVFGK